jgi:hypothetical protein
MADVKEERLEWLWPKRIPQGALTIIAGHPGASKSTLSLDLIARVSTGREWPDGSPSSGPADCVLVQIEDDIASTVFARLRTAEADFSRVHVLEDIETGRGDREEWSLEYADLLKAKIIETKASLIVLDPLSCFMGNVGDGNDPMKIRRALRPLVDLARETRVAVVAIAHPNKGTASKAQYAVSGSHALVAVARAAWMVYVDREDKDRRLFLNAKMNLARDVGGLAYRVRDVLDHPRIEWDSRPVDISADDYQRIENEADSKVDGAAGWILEKLVGGPVSSNELEAMAKEEKIAWRSIQRAKKVILAGRVEAFQRAGEWYWRVLEAAKA